MSTIFAQMTETQIEHSRWWAMRIINSDPGRCSDYQKGMAKAWLGATNGKRGDPSDKLCRIFFAIYREFINTPMGDLTGNLEVLEDEDT